MTPFEQAVEVAAKGLWEDLRETSEGDLTWDALGPMRQYQIKGLALPAVQALQDAGLLKEQA